MAKRPDDSEEPGRPVQTSPLLAGVVLGFMLSWISFGLTALFLYSEYVDTTTSAQTVAAVAALLAPAVVAGALMVPRRTRYVGAGALMGFAIGGILGAGVCGAFIGTGTL